MRQIFICAATVAMILENADGMLQHEHDENQRNIAELQNNANPNHNIAEQNNANGYYVLSDDQRIEIPFGTTSIKKGDIPHNVTYITIPESVTDIGEGAL